MVFSYWEGAKAVANRFLEAWRPFDAEVRVFAEAEVETLIASMDLAWLDLFGNIRIPACKSDIARLVVLVHFGGLYFDIHTAPGDEAALQRLRSSLLTYEFVLFRATDYLERDKLYIPNGALLARRQSLVVLYLIESAFRVLAHHREREISTVGHLDYDIAALTGGWLYGLKLLDMATFPFNPIPAFRDLVRVEDVHSVNHHPAFKWYANYGYRSKGEHWSERQKNEFLFIRG